MVLVPGARATLGHADLEDRRPFTATVASFYLDRTEVTVEAYTACVRSGRCGAYTRSFSNARATHTDAQRRWLLAQCTHGVPDREQHPMNCVSHAEASAFCAARGARLPTQDEWEYAVSGTTRRPYPRGHEPATVGMRANLDDVALERELARLGVATSRSFLSVDDGFAATAPVRVFPEDVTPSGQFDMGGNVREWTSTASTYERRWPAGALVSTCGGDWYAGSVDAPVCLGDLRETRAPELGFRCAQGVARAPSRVERRGRR